MKKCLVFAAVVLFALAGLSLNGCGGGGESGKDWQGIIEQKAGYHPEGTADTEDPSLGKFTIEIAWPPSQAQMEQLAGAIEASVPVKPLTVEQEDNYRKLVRDKANFVEIYFCPQGQEICQIKDGINRFLVPRPVNGNPLTEARFFNIPLGQTIIYAKPTIHLGWSQPMHGKAQANIEAGKTKTVSIKLSLADSVSFVFGVAGLPPSNFLPGKDYKMYVFDGDGNRYEGLGQWRKKDYKVTDILPIGEDMMIFEIMLPIGIGPRASFRLEGEGGLIYSHTEVAFDFTVGLGKITMLNQTGGNVTITLIW